MDMWHFLIPLKESNRATGYHVVMAAAQELTSEQPGFVNQLMNQRAVLK